MKPYIHLFRTPRRYYCFDVNTDEIIMIPENVYNYLENRCDEDILDEKNAGFVNTLRQQGYLSSHRLSAVRHCHTDDLGYYLENRMSEVLLQVTQVCNLNCCYCPYAVGTGFSRQRDHSSKVMSWETAKRSLDFLLDHSSEIVDIAVGFYGGEPFLAFPLIRKAVEYVEENFAGKRVWYSTTTNGTALNDEIIAFLVEKNFHVTFSIDGPEHIHDTNRRRGDGTGSFRQAFENLKKTITAFGDEKKDQVNINTVLNPANDTDEVRELFRDPFFRDHEVFFTISPASDNIRDTAFYAREGHYEQTVYHAFTGLLSNLGLVEGLKTDPVINKYYNSHTNTSDRIKRKKMLPDISAPGGPCVPGQHRVFVNADGDMFPCERVTELSDAAKIGSIYTGFDLEKAEAMLNIGQLTEDICKNCWAFRHCKICAAKAIRDQELSGKEKLKYCEKTKNSVNTDLRFIALKRELESVYKRNLVL